MLNCTLQRTIPSNNCADFLTYQIFISMVGFDTRKWKYGIDFPLLVPFNAVSH